MKNRNLIIGFEGDAGAGKDTCASMFEYICEVGIHKATCAEWMTRYKINNKKTYSVLHFADPLKDLCSNITGLNRDLFELHQYKDELWWKYGTDKFITEDELNKLNNICIISPTVNNSISEQLFIARKNKQESYIKLRKILQFVGTEMFRNLYDNNYWTNLTVENVLKTYKQYNYAFIADVRFKEEITNLKINIHERIQTANRPIIKFINIGKEDNFAENITKDNHISAKRLNKFDYYICNKKIDFIPLFIKCIKLYENIILD